MGAEEGRASEAYVFCLLHHAEKVSVDPLDLTQWSFYVVPTRWLDEQFPKQQRLSLAALQKIQSKSLTFDELRDQFHQFATIGKTEDA